MQKYLRHAVFAAFLLVIWGCTRNVPLLENFSPGPMPVIDYSGYEKNATPEIFFRLGQSHFTDIDFNPDGRFILSSGIAGLKLWNIDGMLLKTIRVPNVTDITAFTPDGKKIVSGGLGGFSALEIDGTLLWGNHKEHVFSLDVSPDGRLIACGCAGTIRIWHMDGRLMKTFNTHGDDIAAIAFSPDGKMIVSGSGKGAVRLWHIGGELYKTLRGHTEKVGSIAFRPDGKVIVSGSEDKTIRMWDAEGRALKTLRGFKYAVNRVACSPDGKLIASIGIDGLYLWRTDGELIMKRAAMKDCLAFSPDGKMMATGDGAERRIDLFNTKLEKVMTVKGETGEKVEAVAVSPDGKTIVSASHGRTLLWRRDGALSDTIETGSWPSDIRFTSDGDPVIAGSGGDFRKNAYAVWLLNGDKGLVESREKHRGWINKVILNPKRKLMASGSQDKTIKLWDHHGKLLKTLTGHQGPVSTVAYSPDGEVLASGSSDKTVRLWDGSGNVIRTLTGHSAAVIAMTFNFDGSMLASTSLDKTIRLWSGSGRLLDVITPGAVPLCIAFSPDNRMIACGLRDHTIRIFSVGGTLLKVLKGHKDRVNSIAFGPRGRFLVSAGSDSTTKIWDIHTGGHVSFISVGKEWIVFTHDGYFDSSRNGGALVTMVKGFQAFGIDQFAMRNNRPDVILKRLGNENHELIAHYYKQYRKRLRRAGLTEKNLTDDYHIPEAKILKTKRVDKFLEIDFVLRDDRYDLQSYNIFINDVPLFGGMGKEVTGKFFRKSERIELSAGMNKIEISVVNQTGSESFRVPTTAYYHKPVKSDLYYLGFGVSKYKDPDLDLQYADKDARDLAKLLAGWNGRSLDFKADMTSAETLDEIERLLASPGSGRSTGASVFTRTYLNREVTVQNIKKAKEFIRKSKVDDIFILFIAGHGVHDTDDDSTYYYLTHDADVRELADRAAKFELIENLLQGIPPRKKLFLIDTCESGEAEEDLEAGYLAGAESRGIRARTTRAIRVKRKHDGAVRKRDRYYLLDKNRFIYSDLVRRSGAIVFSSSRGSEFSYEDDRIKNGFFTEAIIRALTGGKADSDRNNWVTTDELKDYVSTLVPKMTGGMQHPTVDRDNIFQKFALPVR